MTSPPTKKQVETAYNLALFPDKFIEATILFRKFYEKECMEIGRECPTQGHLDWYDALMASVDNISNTLTVHEDAYHKQGLESLRYAVIHMLLLLDAYLLEKEELRNTFTTYLAGEEDETEHD